MPGPLFHHIARFVVSLALLAMAPAVAAAGQPAADAAEAPAVGAVRAFLLDTDASWLVHMPGKRKVGAW